jgi:hypothetical protein
VDSHELGHRFIQSATSGISEKSRASALPLSAHARSRPRARRRRGGRLWPALGVAHRDRLAPPPGSPSFNARLPSRAWRDSTESSWSHSPLSPRRGGTSCASSNPRPFFAGTAPASRLFGGGGAERSPRRASLRRRPRLSGPWPRRTHSGAAERIRGELLKLGVKVSKLTIQKYMRAAARQTARAALVHVSTKPRPGDLGLRLSAGL